MSKKEIKNNYAPNDVFGDPRSYSWGNNIWGKKMSMLGLALIIIVGGIVIYADSKGIIDWRQTGDPMEQTHPLFRDTTGRRPLR